MEVVLMGGGIEQHVGFGDGVQHTKPGALKAVMYGVVRCQPGDPLTIVMLVRMHRGRPAKRNACTSVAIQPL